MPSRDLAVEQETSPFQGHKLLLDGQQRLTSLSAILRGIQVSVRGRKKPIDILFNLEHSDGPPVEVLEVEEDAEIDDNGLETEDEEGGPNLNERLKLRTFVVSNKSLLVDPHWVKVSEIFQEEKSDTQLLKGLVRSFEDPLFDKYSKRLQAVRKIRDYPYVMHVLNKELSYEEVAEIFVRVNSLGIKLRGSDLALAQITSRWQDSLKLFEQFQEECEEKWFTLDLGLFVRALVVFATGQSRFRTVGAISLQRLKAGWEEAKNGIRFSLNFLRANAGIEDESLLSSPLFIITVAYFAKHQNYQLTAGDESGLRRWLYIANARAHYSGSSETTLDADLNIIKKSGTTAELLDVLRQKVGRFEIEPNDLKGRGQTSALFSIAYLALKARGAKDWRTRLGLSLTHQGPQHFIEHHHIFPKSLLKKAGYSIAETNEIANMAFVTGATNRSFSAKPPEEYLQTILAEQGKQALETHCVPTDPSLWSLESYQSFLQYRREALSKAINEFIQSNDLTQDIIDLDSLIRSGENDEVEFKASARWDYGEEMLNKGLETSIVKTIAGFLNGKGGVLIIGVADNGNVLGLVPDYKTLSKRPDRDGYQQFLVNLFSINMGKDICAYLSISFHPVGGEEVFVIRVERSSRAIYIQDGQQTRFYVRSGNTTQELAGRELVNYTTQKWPNS